MTDFGWDMPTAPGPIDEGNSSNLPTVQGSGAVATQMSLGDKLEVRRAAIALPRDLGVVRRQLEQMAEWSGDSFEYSFPISGQLISGPSIKCTNAVARAWGNCSIMTSNVQDIGDAWIIYSTFVDHQTGFDLTRGFRQRKGQKSLRGDAGRAEDIAFQIGVSKSARNVVRNALGDVVDEAIRYARRRMTKQIEARPDEYRTRIKGRLETLNYPLVKVEAWAAEKIDKWPSAMIAQVVRILTAQSEGAIDDLDTVFAPKGVDIAGKIGASNGDASQTAPEPRQAVPAAQAPAEPADKPVPAHEPPVPAQQQPKRRGRPPSPQTIARQIIAEIENADPMDLDAILQTHQADIDSLPDDVQMEITAAAVERARDPSNGDIIGDDGQAWDPETGEVIADDAAEPLAIYPEAPTFRLSLLNERMEKVDLSVTAEDWVERLNGALIAEQDKNRLRAYNQACARAIRMQRPDLAGDLDEIAGMWS